MDIAPHIIQHFQALITENTEKTESNKQTDNSGIFEITRFRNIFYQYQRYLYYYAPNNISYKKTCVFSFSKFQNFFYTYNTATDSNLIIKLVN